MARTNYRYVTEYGQLYRLTERNFKRYMEALRKDVETLPDSFGVRVGYVSLDLTDRNPEAVEQCLDSFDMEQGK